MISFESDYNNGAHPHVLQYLLDTNDNQSASYGYDEWSESARIKIREACRLENAGIYFLVGGTQTNATVIDSLLSQYEGVVSVDTGHINVHESGAIEASGHKVITLSSHEGKMHAEDLLTLLKKFHADPTCEHMVWPGMVYITFPTELGTIYKSFEIEEIQNICKQYNIPLFVDGARLGYGLMSDECDFDLPWLARHCDVFYIGGTKIGALCGEAVVFTNNNVPKHFFSIVKQHGALLAKSRLVGVQFDALFTDNLYFNISRHAIDMAMRMRKIFSNAGFTLKDSPTNQQFVVLTNKQMERLAQYVAFETWEPIDENNTLCRFVTNWATKESDLETLKNAISTI
ncbi:MAG: threonine aldolase family protein [Prevotella koreensis]|uniref:threonine aldolase family protein n=1 Tax=Prevotella koreensis TaxID=2490854 RepID=UPI003F9F7B55